MFTKGMVEQGVSHNTIRIFLLKDFLFAHQSLTFATTLWLCVCWEGLCGCVCAGRDSVVVRVLGGTLWLCVCWEGLCGCACTGRASVAKAHTLSNRQTKSARVNVF